MNGATALDCENTISRPNSTKTTTIGISQYFFSWRRKSQNSANTRLLLIPPQYMPENALRRRINESLPATRPDEGKRNEHDRRQKVLAAQAFGHDVVLRSALMTVTIPRAIDAPSASRPAGAIGSCAPTRRFPTMKAASVSDPIAGARSSTRAAIGTTRKCRFQSARSGCWTYPNNAAMGMDERAKSRSCRGARKNPTGGRMYRTPNSLNIADAMPRALWRCNQPTRFAPPPRSADALPA